MLQSIVDSISTWFSSVWDFLFDPIYVWYFWGFVALLAGLVVSYFLPFKWVRAGIGGVLLLIGAYIAGGRQMHGDMKEQIDDAKRKAKSQTVPQHTWPTWF